MTGPPLATSMDFTAAGLVPMVAGVASAIILLWLCLVGAHGPRRAWIATHWLLRESAVGDRNTDEVRGAQRTTHSACRGSAGEQELRMFGLVGWTIDRFIARRTRLPNFARRHPPARAPVIWSVLIVTAANIMVFAALASGAAAGRVTLGELVVFAQCAVGTSAIAFGGLSWVLDGSAAPVVAVLRLEAAMAPAGALAAGRRPAATLPGREIRFHDVTFAYPGGSPVLEHLDLTVPAGTSLAIVGQNGAGKTTLAKLLCRLYDPQSGTIEVDGVDLREFDIASWRARLAVVFQDFIRFELPMRDNVAPSARQTMPSWRFESPARSASRLDTVLARGYEGGTTVRRPVAACAGAALCRATGRRRRAAG